MNQDSSSIAALQARIAALEKENALLRRGNDRPGGKAVLVPDALKPLFERAEQTVGEYFRHLDMDPARGTIEINDERYLLIRASALSKDFLDTVLGLYADRGEEAAFAIGKNFLFDIAHVIGMNDARSFHEKMKLTDPVARLSAGPVHFAYTGWAFVDIMPESHPTPDDDFYLLYRHPYSFEADSWKRSGKRSAAPVCIMNSGYSSGWCEASFGIPLTAVEVSCTARGDEHCTFIMSPPHRIQEHLEQYEASSGYKYPNEKDYDVPTFFDRKRVEEEMQRARLLAEDSARMKDDFLANISHELRTPLSAILGFTEQLAKTELDAAQKDYLSAVTDSGNTLLSIINDILDLSKMDAGKFLVEEHPFSVQSLMKSVYLMFSEKAAKKTLRFELQPDVPDMPLLGDPARIRQVLVNLTGNALKFTEEGYVRLSCSIEREEESMVWIRFSVGDSGIGIPEEKWAGIFERFTQADSQITRKYGGTGLGLAIARELAELMGGSLKLHKNDNTGMVFHFSLPFKKANVRPVEPVAHANAFIPKKPAGRHVLVVEDNPINQKLAAIILLNNGYEVTSASDGSQALILLKKQGFDLILMDIQMPVMDGIKATCLIREELRLDTPIIAMTAHALPAEQEQCFLAGIDAYLSKPFTEAALMEQIDLLLNKPEEGEARGVTDLSFLYQQTRNNTAMIAEMVQAFLSQNPVDLAALELAADQGDFTALYRQAHSLRSSTSLFGLDKKIGESLLRIEKLSRAKEGLEEIRALLPYIANICRQARAELETSISL
ncbi:MAG TPA: response regulator [Flavisolibacter sp.]|nr:response regulator [Flavisolibacter sp.]